jgi:hypothetical protein
MAIATQYRDANASLQICQSEANVSMVLSRDDNGSVLRRFGHEAASILINHLSVPHYATSTAVAYIAPSRQAIALVFFDERGCMSYNSHIDLDEWHEVTQRVDHELNGEPT